MLDELTRLAFLRWGVWSCADAARFGLTKDVLAALVRAGVVWQPARGWYAVREPDADRRRLHGQRVHALVARHKGAALASHHSALVVSGVPVHAADLSVVHLAHAGHGSYRSRPGYVVHAADASVRRCAGDPVSLATAVPLEHAVIQTGLCAGPVDAIVAGDYLIRRGQVTRESLARALGGHRHRRGIGSVADAIDWVHPDTESVGESVLRYAMQLLGYPVTPQFKVRGRCVWRIELVVEGTRVAVEFDGRGKYADPDEGPRQAWRQELIEQQRWVFVRVRWHELFRRGSTELDLVSLRARIDNAIGRAALLAADLGK